MQKADASEFEDKSKLRLTRGESAVIEGNLELQSLRVGRGSHLKVKGNLTVRDDMDVYRRNARVDITGRLRVNKELNIRRNSTVDINGSLIFEGRSIDISRQSKLYLGNELRSTDSTIRLNRGSNIKVDQGDFMCGSLKIRDSRSRVKVERGCLTADNVYVSSEDSLVVNEIIADTSPRKSVNDSGKYVSDDKEDSDTDLFDVSKEPKESLDVHEYNPNMDTSDLVVWMEAKIMSESENQDFPFKEFNRVVRQYPELRNILGSVKTAQDAKKISENNSNINLSRYQIDKLTDTEETAKRADRDGIEQLRRIGEKIDEYEPSAVEYLESNQNSESEDLGDFEDSEDSNSSTSGSDDVSAFDW